MANVQQGQTVNQEFGRATQIVPGANDAGKIRPRNDAASWKTLISSSNLRRWRRRFTSLPVFLSSGRF